MRPVFFLPLGRNDSEVWPSCPSADKLLELPPRLAKEVEAGMVDAAGASMADPHVAAVEGCAGWPSDVVNALVAAGWNDDGNCIL